MARNMHPNSLANLNPCTTTEEAKERGSKGGKKSVETRREQKKARELVNIIFSTKVKGNNNQKMLGELGVEQEDQTNKALLLATQYFKAIKGDTIAAKTLLEISGDLEPDNENEGVKPEININISAATPADIDVD